MFNKLLALMTVLLGSHYLLENSTPYQHILWISTHAKAYGLTLIFVGFVIALEETLKRFFKPLDNKSGD